MYYQKNSRSSVTLVKQEWKCFLYSSVMCILENQNGISFTKSKKLKYCYCSLLWVVFQLTELNFNWKKVTWPLFVLSTVSKSITVKNYLVLVVLLSSLNSWPIVHNSLSSMCWSGLNSPLKQSWALEFFQCISFLQLPATWHWWFKHS